MLKISKAALAAAAFSLPVLPVAGLVVPAFAEETVTTSTSGFNLSLSIPTISLVDSSMDEAAIRELLSGKFLDRAGELAKLNATSITIPEITMTSATSVGGTAQASTTTYKDIVLSDVKDGVAKSFVIGSSEAKSPEGTFSYVKQEYTGVDMGAILEFLGVVPGDAAGAAAPAYAGWSLEGGSFKNEQVSCTFNGWTGSSLNVKPSAITLGAVIDAGMKMQASQSNPPPEAMKTVFTYVAGLLQHVQSDSSKFEGLSCAGKDDSGKPISVSLGSIDVGVFAPAIYPSIAVNGLKVVAEDGSVSLDNFTIKTIDLNQPIAVLSGDDVQWTEAWFTTNARRLIPAFAGLSAKGLKIDVPDPEKPGSRIAANVADFDLTLSDYLNGIPTRISSKTSGLDIPLQASSEDESVKTLLALGIDRVNLNYDLSASWDKASQTVNFDRISVSGNDLGSFAVAAVIGSATDQLFDIDPNVQQAASMGVTVKSIKLDLVDAGLGDKLTPMLAAQQNADPATFRTQIAGIVEGAAIQLLGSTDAARALGKTVSDFAKGTSKNVSITITSKDPAGLPVPLLMQASNDPTILVNAVDITGQ